MDDYRVEEMGKGWRVANAERGTVGVVMHMGNRFRAAVDDADEARTIGYGQSLRDVVLQVIWYDRAMNQEVE